MRYADSKWKRSPEYTYLKGKVSETYGRMVGSRNVKETGGRQEQRRQRT